MANVRKIEYSETLRRMTVEDLQVLRAAGKTLLKNLPLSVLKGSLRKKLINAINHSRLISDKID